MCAVIVVLVQSSESGLDARSTCQSFFAESFSAELYSPMQLTSVLTG